METAAAKAGTGMDKDQAIALLKRKYGVAQAIEQALALMRWDAATGGVPEQSYGARGRGEGWLVGERLRLFVAADTEEAIEALKKARDDNAFGDNAGDLGGTGSASGASGAEPPRQGGAEPPAQGVAELPEPFLQAACLRVTARDYERMKKVPPAEMEAYQALVSESANVWEGARRENDFARMERYYAQIFEYQKKFCEWYGYAKHPYDALLEGYEEGLTVEKLDGFFSALRDEIVPLLHTLQSSGYKPQPVEGSFPVAKQRALGPWLASSVGYDLKRGRMGEVEHPFTTTINRNDVRVTTKYHENSLLSAVFSTIHECGHGIYDQNMDPALDDYGLGEGASMSVHESQSRLFENYFGRSRPFCAFLLPKLKEAFPEAFGGADWDAERLYRAACAARASLVRIEADELTYCLHIMVRYEIEKAMIEGKLAAADLPAAWNDAYERYLGIRPDSDARGVLQDVHWSEGLVGYFPSYALGSAYAAQIARPLWKDVGADALLLRGDFAPICAWLRERIHRFGGALTPEQVLLRATGEAFNPAYYVEYLKNKYAEFKSF